MSAALGKLTLAAVLVLAVVPARADILVGVAGPLSGELGPLGQQMQTGASEAIAAINATGGVDGQMLKLEAIHDGCDAKKADAAANQLAADGAALVAGHLCLKASIAGAAVYAADRVVQISPGTTFGKFTDARPGPGIFRLAGRDDSEGAFAGAMLADRFRDRKIAIVDDRSAYGTTLAEAVLAALTAAGGTAAVRDSYDAGGKDYSPLVSRLEDSAIDAVFIADSAPEIAIIAREIREIRERGLATVIVSGDALLDQAYGAKAGDAADGTLVAYPADPRHAPAAAPVVAALAERKIEAGGYVLPAYAAVQVWAAAAKAAGSTDFDKVVAALQGGQFATVIGNVTFDEKGDLRAPAYQWYVWHGGDFLPEGM
jgi:branched-chain amino acid transport system substrate-binding protein